MSKCTHIAIQFNFKPVSEHSLDVLYFDGHLDRETNSDEKMSLNWHFDQSAQL